MSKQIAVAATGTVECQYILDYHDRKKKMRLAYPTTIFDGLSNSFQVKMLEKPDGGTDDDPEGTVGERMHGSVYASENDAKGIENDGSKIAVVAR